MDPGYLEPVHKRPAERGTVLAQRRDRLGQQGRRTQVFLDQRSESCGILVGRRFSQLPAGSRCTITGMRAFVAVTNPEWYRFLSDPTRSEIPVVNFWKPGGGSFRALNDGEYFVFKAGCILVSDATFVPVGLSFDLPPGWARSGIQQGKTYDMAGYDVAGYFADIMHIIPDEDATAEAGEPWEASGPIYGNPTLTRYRLRQNVFHAVVLNAYRGRCAITGSRIRPALQSAHIRPVASGGKNRLDNGLLLRSDVHAMFDGGYLGVDPAYRLRVSPRLRDEFGNGEQFYAQAGQLIALPEHRIDRPQRELLEWHLDEVFKAS
jgi:putative restriction endonuclease